MRDCAGRLEYFVIILFFQSVLHIEFTDSRSLAKNLRRNLNSTNTVKEDEATNRMKDPGRTGKLAGASRRNPALLGYPRLINAPTSRMPDLHPNSMNDTILSTGEPRFINPLYPLSENSLSAYGVLLLSLVVFAVGIVGNLSIMCIVWHSMSMKSARDSILAAGAFWDFLILFFCLPVIVFQQITHYRLFGTLSCRIVPFMEVSSFGVSTFSLCALGIDRFQLITSFQSSLKPEEQCQSILGKLSVVWLGSLTLAVPEIFLWQLNKERSPALDLIIDSCVMEPSSELSPVLYSLILTYKQARIWWFLGCYFCLPLLFTITSLLVTLRIVGSSKNIKDAEKQRQLSWIVACLAIVYAIGILPEHVINILFTYTSFEVSYNLLTFITQFFLFLKCAITPVFLLLTSKPLGQTFIDCCCCCCDGEHKPLHRMEDITGKLEPTYDYTNDSGLQLGTPC